MSGKARRDDYPTEYICHWCPRSQYYAGFDQLLAQLAQGWFIHGMISFDEYWHGGARRVLIYHVTLHHGEEAVQMRVLNNPAAERFIAGLKNPLVPKRFVPNSPASHPRQRSHPIDSHMQSRNENRH